MAGAFNFTANLNVQLDAGSIRGVQTQINQALKGLSVPVNIVFSPTAQTGLNQINAAVTTLTNNLRTLQAEASRTNAVLSTLSSGLGRFSTSANAVGSATTNLARGTNSTATAAKLGADQFEYFGHQMRLTTQRFLAFTASVGGLLSVIRLFREAATEAYNFERQMVTISQISSESAGEVAGLGKAVGDVAIRYGVSSKSLITVAEQLKQTGLSIKEVQSALEPLAKASLAPSFGNIEKTTQGAIAATRQFGIEIKDLEGALGSINAVAAGFAVESQDIIEAVKRAGGAFKAAGGDLNEFNALFTAIRATTRQSAETIATGMRTIFTRLQRTDTIENLKQLGIQLQYTRKEAEQLGNVNLENQFVGPMEAVRRISQEVRNLSSTDPRFANIAEQIGGYRQIAQIVPLLQQGRVVQDAYNTSLSGQISLSIAAEKSEGALFRQLERVNEQFLQLGRNVLADAGFRAFISGALKLASALTSILDSLRPLIPMLAAFTAFKIGQNLGGIGSIVQGISRGPFGLKFHSGGLVGGTGERPATLEGGEYVLNKHVSRAIGHQTLNRLNFAGGGRVKPMTAGTLRSILEEEQSGLYEGSSWPIVPMVKGILSSPSKLKRIARQIPAGSTRLASGTEALVLRTPEGEVIRLGHFYGNAETGREFTGRLNIPEMLQPTRSKVIDNHLVERLPFVPSLRASRERAGYGSPAYEEINKMRSSLEERGYKARDLTDENVARLPSGKLIAIDPGAIESIPMAKGGIVNAMVMPGEVVVPPEQVNRIGINRLHRMNDEGRYAEGGVVAGSGSQDNVPLFLRDGSFVIKKRSAQKLGLSHYADGGLTDAQRAYGLHTPDALTEEELRKLVEQNIKRITGIAAKKYPRLGDEARSIAGLEAYQTGRLFDPAKVQKYTLSRSDLSSQDPVIQERVNRSFSLHVLKATQARIRTELLGRGRGGVSDAPEGAILSGTSDEAILGGLGGVSHIEQRPILGTEKSQERDAKSVEFQYKKFYAEERKAKEAQAAAVAKEEAILAASRVKAERGGDTSAPVRVGSMRDRLAARRAASATPTVDPISSALVPYGQNYPVVPYQDTGVIPYREPGIPVRFRGPLVPPNRRIPENIPDADFTVRYPTTPGGSRAIVPYAGRQGVPVQEAYGFLNESALQSPPLKYRPGKGWSDRVREATEGPIGTYGLRDDVYGTIPLADHPGAHTLRYNTGGIRGAPTNIQYAQTGIGMDEPYNVLDSQGRIGIGGIAPTRSKVTGYQGAGAIIAERTKAEYAAQGGVSAISLQSRRGIYAEQQARLDQELLAVTTRQLQVLRPTISRQEAELVATEQLAKAKLENARILQDTRGRTIGLENNVNALTAAGRRSDGRTGIGGTIIDAFGDFGNRLNQRTAGVRGLNNRLTQFVGGTGALSTGAFVVGAGLQYAAGGIEGLAGSAEDAARQNRTGSYVGLKGAGGALAGAATGAAIGSVFGVLGAGLGAAIGGLTGFVASINQASTEIRDAKIGASVASFTDKLNRLAGQAPTERSSSDIVGALSDIDKAKAEIREKATYEATRPFSFRSDTYAAVSGRETRQAFGGQIGAINQTIEREIEQTVRQSGGRGNARDVAQLVAGGGHGLNQELLKITAQVRNVPLRQVMDELSKSVLRAQRSVRADQDVRAGQVAEGRNLAAFGRLASAAENASLAIEKMDIQAKLISDTFSGQLGATRITAQTGLLGEIGSANTGNFRGALGGITAGLGVGGQRLFEAGDAANRVGQLLPGILSQVVASNPFQQEDFTGATRRSLYQGLGFQGEKDAPEQIQRAIESVVGQLRGLKLEDIFKESQADVTKLSERILQPLTGPLKDAGVKIGKALETEGNRFIDGLTEYAKQTEVIAGGQDRISQLQLGTVRQKATFAQQAGFRQDIGLDVLNQPFQQRQERLVGVAGAAASDPGFIAARLAQVRGQLIGASERQQAAFQATGGTGPRFEAAATEMVRLRDQASRLQQALGHLADASERNAGAQEKLSNIQRDRESRQSFGEHLINASPEERVQIQRGLILSNQANNAGSLRGFGDEDQKLILQTISSLGNAKLTGFAGQPNAVDLRTRLVNDYLGAGQVDPGYGQEEKNLQQQVLQNMKQAIEAEQASIVNREALQASFFQNLQQSHQQFLTELRNTLALNQLADKKVQLGQVGSDLQQLRKTSGQAQILRAAGLTTSSQIQSLQDPKTKSLLDAYVTASTRSKNEQDLFAQAGRLEQVRATGGGTTTNFPRYLTEQGITNPEDQNTIFKKVYEGSRNRLTAAGIDIETARTGPRKEESIRIVEEEVAKAISFQQYASVSRNANAVNKASTDLNAQVGGGFRIQNAGDITAFTQAIDALKGKSFEDLNAQINATTTQFQQLGATIAAMQNGGAAPGFAVGGVVPGRPQGTDTVPAWLTPNEYVINAASAKANVALLETINKARGPIYRAEGGWTPPSQFFRELLFGRQIKPVEDVGGGGWTEDDEEKRRVGVINRREPAVSPEIEQARRSRDSGPIPPPAAPDGPPGGDINSPEYRFFLRTGRKPNPGELQQFMMSGEVPPTDGPPGGDINSPEHRFFLRTGRHATPLELQQFMMTGEVGSPPAAAPPNVEPPAFALPKAAPKGPLPLPGFDNVPGVVADEIRRRRAAEVVGPVAPDVAPAPAAAAPAITKEEALDASRRQALTNPSGLSGQFLLSQVLRGDEQSRSNALAGQYYGGQIASLASRQRLARVAESGAPGAAEQFGIASTARGRTGEANRNARNADWVTQELLRKRREQYAGAQRFASGGFVTGGFGGVDDVATNLTRGEFVFSKPAADALGSAALERMHYLAKGGRVQYLAAGGFAGGPPSSAGGPGGIDMSSFVRTGDSLSLAINNFTQSGTNLTQAFNTFAGKAESLAQALSNFPSTLKVEGQQRVEVIVNGAEALSQMTPIISQMIEQKTGEAIKNLLKEKFPDA